MAAEQVITDAGRRPPAVRRPGAEVYYTSVPTRGGDYWKFDQAARVRAVGAVPRRPARRAGARRPEAALLPARPRPDRRAGAGPGAPPGARVRRLQPDARPSRRSRSARRSAGPTSTRRRIPATSSTSRACGAASSSSTSPTRRTTSSRATRQQRLGAGRAAAVQPGRAGLPGLRARAPPGPVSPTAPAAPRAGSCRSASSAAPAAKSTIRGYLYGAVCALTWSCSSRARPSDGGEAVAQHDDRAHDRAALVVGRGDDRRLGHRRVLDERRLDLERADPVAGGDDHVVGAALEVQEAVLVLGDAVAGAPRRPRRRVGSPR